VPTDPFHWEHTWQPVDVGEWRPIGPPAHPAFTTVMTWRIESFGDVDGQKDREFLKILDLPARTAAPIELAINGPREFLRQHGWRCRDAFAVSHNCAVYREYLRASLGEFSVAKHAYVQTNSGWFSDRTECYLASGRPAVVQDTGFSTHLPTGEGLFAYRTVDEACAGLEAIQAHYDRHARAARDLALAHFAPEAVLPALLERATARPSARRLAAVE
jgi:hypothetical protein